MDKFRVLTIFSKALLRHMQGSAELFDKNHIFYEALREIEKNNWKEEANKAFEEEIENVKRLAEPVIEEYKDYIISCKKDENAEDYFNRCFWKLGVDGKERIITDYFIANNKEISKEELEEALKKRKAEDKNNLKLFFNIQAKITRGEDFDKDELFKVTKGICEHGLYKVATKLLPIAVNCDNSEKLVADYDSMFDVYLY